MARYTPEQLRNAAILARASRRPIIRKAILESGLVEANLGDPPAGDRDSEGGLQQRPSQGWGPASESLSTDARQFVRAAHRVLARGFRGSAGQLAQAVQRSAFPGRYAARGGEAEALLRSVGGGSSSRSGGATAVLPNVGGGSAGADLSPGADVSGAVAALLSGARSTAPPVSGPAAPAYSARAALPQGYVAPSSGGPAVQEGPDVGALLDAVRTRGGDLGAGGASDAGGGRIQASGGTSGGGGGKSPLRELFYNGPGGINVKDGQREPRGFVSGHTDHVHVAAGPKTVVKLGRLAERMGLHVGENPHFGGVNPVHVQGSYHYKNEAIDVSGSAKAMQAFNRRVARLYGLG